MYWTYGYNSGNSPQKNLAPSPPLRAKTSLQVHLSGQKTSLQVHLYNSEFSTGCGVPSTPRGRNEEPACGGRTGGHDSEPKETGAEKPTLRDVKPEDLRNPARLLDLHAQAVAAGYVSPSEADRLRLFAAAEHARVIGSRNPPGLFARIVRSGLWHFCTQDDEDVARVELRSALHPERPAERPARGEAPMAFTGTGGGLSDDARFVRDITNVLR